MGALCCKHHDYSAANVHENARAVEIARRIEQETVAENRIKKLLLLGSADSGKSTIFKQTKLLFQSGFDESEFASYVPLILENAFEAVKLLCDWASELALKETDTSNPPEGKDIFAKLAEMGNHLDTKFLANDIANEIEALWKDAAVQGAFSTHVGLQFPVRAYYFLENLQRLVDPNFVPTKDDVLNSSIGTTGVSEIYFSISVDGRGEAYRLFDVGGQRNERRKWIHLFEHVTAIIFCAAINEYDQTLFEDEQKNRMMETKELFEWVLKQKCFEKASFILFLNKFDLFETKVVTVPLSVCEWFKDYEPVSTDKQETEHAYEFVKKKFEELYFQSTAPEHVDRVFKIYRITALDQKLVKRAFKRIDETLRLKNLHEADSL